MKSKTLLENVKTYHHEEVILRFMDGYDVEYEEAKDIFNEMKNLLCLFHEYPNEYIFTHEPLWVIDEMWHTFILFTKDYLDFCTKYFGGIIHHNITPREAKQKIIENLKSNKAETEEELKPHVQNLYEKIYEYLGRETLIKWIKVYAEKYSVAHMNSIRKPLAV